MNNVKFENKDLRNLMIILKNSYNIDGCKIAGKLFDLINYQIVERGQK